jgi:hypothetical protein
MAAILISACTVTVEAALGSVNLYKIVTPSTADQADTIDLSTVCDAGNIMSASAENATDGLITAVVSTAGTITLPSGGTDNQVRNCWVIARSPESA